MPDTPTGTPPLGVFLARYREDDNEWWTLSAGDHMNLFDALLDKVEVAEAKLRSVRLAARQWAVADRMEGSLASCDDRVYAAAGRYLLDAMGEPRPDPEAHAHRAGETPEEIEQ